MYAEFHRNADPANTAEEKSDPLKVLDLAGILGENQILIDTIFTNGLGAFLSGQLTLIAYNTLLSKVWVERADYLQRVKEATNDDDFQQIIFQNLISGYIPFETAENLLNAPAIRKKMFGFVAEESETATPVTISKSPSLQAIAELDTDTFESKLTALASLSERIPHALAVILQNGSDNYLEGQHKITKERFNEIIEMAKSNRAKLLERCHEKFEGLYGINFVEVLNNELMSDRISPEDYKRLTKPKPRRIHGIPLVSEKKD